MNMDNISIKGLGHLRIICFFLVAVAIGGEALGQTRVGVIYVNSGDNTKDEGSIRDLRTMVSRLNVGGRTFSGGQSLPTHLHTEFRLVIVNTFAQATNMTENKSQHNVDRLILVAHGSFNYSNEYSGNLKDTTEFSTPEEDVKHLFDGTYHCNAEGKFNADQIGNLIKDLYGHDYGGPTADIGFQGGGAEPTPMWNYQVANSSLGFWSTLTFYAETWDGTVLSSREVVVNIFIPTGGGYMYL